MATYIDDLLYRSKAKSFEDYIVLFDKVLPGYPGLLFTPQYIESIRGLPPKLLRLTSKALNLRGVELEAEEALEDPSKKLFGLIQKIHSGMIFFDVPEPVIQRLFPKDRPDPKNTSASELRMMLERISDAFEGVLNGHEIERLKREEVQEVLNSRVELVQVEKTAENAALKARTEIISCVREMDNAISFLSHLSRAENVLQPGIYRALFPVPITSKSSQQKEDSTENKDKNTDPLIDGLGVGGSV